MKKMTKEEIREFNSKVEYNESAAGWIVDIISCIIFPDDSDDSLSPWKV